MRFPEEFRTSLNPPPAMSVLDFPKPVTQRDIAHALGVSVATVSLALRNRPVLSESRRREIQQFAVRAGYRLDAAAAELSGRKKSPANHAITESIAWVTLQRSGETSTVHRRLDDCRVGAEAAAKNLGYRLEEFELGADLTTARLHQILRARGIRCILLSPQSEVLDWKDFPWACYSVAKFGQSELLPAFHRVSPDHVGNVVKAFRAILSRGYRRIGFLTRETGVADCEGHLIEAGFLTAQRLVEEEARIPLCLVKGPCEAAPIATWVEKHRVEAVLSDLSETPVLLKKAGLRFPEDLGLAMLDVGGLPFFSGIHPHPEEIGKTGVHLLHSLLTDNERGTTETPRQLLVNGIWVDGSSLPEHRAFV